MTSNITTATPSITATATATSYRPSPRMQYLMDAYSIACEAVDQCIERLGYDTTPRDVERLRGRREQIGRDLDDEIELEARRASR